MGRAEVERTAWFVVLMYGGTKVEESSVHNTVECGVMVIVMVMVIVIIIVYRGQSHRGS